MGSFIPWYIYQSALSGYLRLISLVQRGCAHISPCDGARLGDTKVNILCIGRYAAYDARFNCIELVKHRRVSWHKDGVIHRNVEIPRAPLFLLTMIGSFRRPREAEA